MKRFLAIPLFLIYFIAITGVMVNLHYCGGEIDSVTVMVEKPNCCCDKDANNSTTHKSVSEKDCCSDKAFTVKINQTQLSNTYLSFDFTSAVAILPPTSIFDFSENRVVNDRHFLSSQRSNAPPGRWQNIPLYSLNSSRVLYS